MGGQQIGISDSEHTGILISLLWSSKPSISVFLLEEVDNILTKQHVSQVMQLTHIWETRWKVMT